MARRVEGRADNGDEVGESREAWKDLKNVEKRGGNRGRKARMGCQGNGEKTK